MSPESRTRTTPEYALTSTSVKCASDTGVEAPPAAQEKLLFILKFSYLHIYGSWGMYQYNRLSMVFCLLKYLCLISLNKDYSKPYHN